MALWEQRVSEHVPAANWRSSSELRDDLPAFIESLAHVLTTGQPGGSTRTAAPHGEQRATLDGYTLKQVLLEYGLLRQVIFEILEAGHGQVPADARDAILDRLDRSRSIASDRYDELSRKRENTVHQQALEREQALRREAERRAAELDATIESLPEAVFISDLESLVRVNRAALEATQFASLEELSRHYGRLAEIFDVRDIGTGERMPRESMPVFRAMQGSEAEIEFSYLTRRSRERRTAVLKSTPVRVGGQVTGAVIMQVDVTERVRHARRLESLQQITEAALAGSTSRKAVLDSAVTLLKEAFDSRLVLIFLLDPGQLPVIEAAAGVTLPVPLPTRFPDSVRTLIARNQPSLVSSLDDEPVFRERMQELGVNAFAAAPLRRRDLRMGLLVVGYEAPTRLDPDDLALLQLSADQLTIALDNAGLYERLQSQVKELETERFIREQFVATVTHDLRSPLTAALLSAQQIVRSPEQSDQNLRLAGRIIDTLDRTDRMIRDLLDAHTIRAGRKPPVEVTSFDLAAELAAACEEFSRVHRQPCRFRSDGPCHGWWSREAVRRIAENLLNNAGKYGAQGAPVDVRLSATSQEVRIEVTNLLEGDPLTATEQAHMFEPFMRTAAARTSSRKGWGLGLPLVRGLVVAQGGTVEVQSTREHGTTFTVTLPIDARPFAF